LVIPFYIPYACKVASLTIEHYVPSGDDIAAHVYYTLLAYHKPSYIVPKIVNGSMISPAAYPNMVEHYNLKDFVEFKGYVSHEEKLYYLSKCRALVLLSTFEGFDIVILEVWALRRPVIVADVESLNKIVTHGLDGYVVENRPEIWAEYVHLLMTNEKLSRQMGSNEYRKLVIKYNVDNQVSELEKLYKELIAEERNNT